MEFAGLNNLNLDLASRTFVSGLETDNQNTIRHKKCKTWHGLCYKLSRLNFLGTVQPGLSDKIFNPVKPQGQINLIDHYLDFL